MEPMYIFDPCVATGAELRVSAALLAWEHLQGWLLPRLDFQ